MQSHGFGYGQRTRFVESFPSASLPRGTFLRRISFSQRKCPEESSNDLSRVANQRRDGRNETKERGERRRIGGTFGWRNARATRHANGKLRIRESREERARKRWPAARDQRPAGSPLPRRETTPARTMAMMPARSEEFPRPGAADVPRATTRAREVTHPFAQPIDRVPGTRRHVRQLLSRRRYRR